MTVTTRSHDYTSISAIEGRLRAEYHALGRAAGYAHADTVIEGEIGDRKLVALSPAELDKEFAHEAAEVANSLPIGALRVITGKSGTAEKG